jgi:hypothetical protein
VRSCPFAACSPPAVAIAAALALTGPAAAAEPALTVAKPKLRAALKCTPGVKDATRTPVMLVTGTGASGDEAYLIGKGAFDAYGAPVCRVNFPITRPPTSRSRSSTSCTGCAPWPRAPAARSPSSASARAACSRASR